MKIDILLNLKKTIDSFSYGENAIGEKITGKEALRAYILDNYLDKLQECGHDRRYIREHINKLYEELEESEKRNCLKSQYFNFTNSEDLTYYIFKSLNLTYEGVLENDFGRFQAKSEYDKLSEKMESMVGALYNLTDTVYICNAKPRRSNFATKVIDFNVIFTTISFFNNRITAIDSMSLENRTMAENQLKIELLAEMFRLSNTFYNYELVQNLLKKPIPTELLMIQYFKLYRESKKSFADKALEELREEDSRSSKYYEKLVSKIEQEINNIIEQKAISKGNTFSESADSASVIIYGKDKFSDYNQRLIFYKYSCIVSLFDFINRAVKSFTKSAYNNFSYFTSKKYKESLNENTKLSNIPVYLQSSDNWKNFFKNLNNQNSLKNNKRIVKGNVDELNDFIDGIGSELHQLSVYLERIKERNYTEEVLNEIKGIFSQYLENIGTIIFINNWGITDKTRNTSKELLDKLDNHSIIISHGQGGVE